MPTDYWEGSLTTFVQFMQIATNSDLNNRNLQLGTACL